MAFRLLRTAATVTAVPNPSCVNSEKNSWYCVHVEVTAKVFFLWSFPSLKPVPGTSCTVKSSTVPLAQNLMPRAPVIEMPVPRLALGFVPVPSATKPYS
jgi:hypothetical protein